MSTETTEEWAARVAPTLDADGWQRAEQEAERRPDGDPVNRWSIVEARALRSYRDKMAARLSGLHRRVLRKTKDSWAAPPWLPGRGNTRWATMAAMRDRYGVVEDGGGSWRRTDFGREVAGILDRDHGRLDAPQQRFIRPGDPVVEVDSERSLDEMAARLTPEQWESLANTGARSTPLAKALLKRRPKHG